MKKQILLGIAIVALASTSAIAQNQNQQQLPQVGRYQILEATFTAAPDSPDKKFQSLVRLDTATGEMLICDYVYAHANNTQWLTNGRCGPFFAPQDVFINKQVKK